MNARWSRSALWLAVWFLASSASGAADDQEANAILEKMSRRADEIRTFKADIKIAVTGPNGMTGSGVGVIIKQNPAKQTEQPGKFSMKLRVTSSKPPVVIVDNIVVVDDGSVLWVELREGETPRVSVVKAKSSMGSARDIGGYPVERGIVVGWMRRRFEFSVMGKALVDGQQMTVLEGVWRQDYLKENPREARRSQDIPRIRWYVGANDFMVHRMVLMGTEGEPVWTLDYENIKVNQPVDPEVFQYRPPPGAEIIDHTSEN